MFVYVWFFFTSGGSRPLSVGAERRERDHRDAPGAYKVLNIHMDSTGGEMHNVFSVCRYIRLVNHSALWEFLLERLTIERTQEG